VKSFWISQKLFKTYEIGPDRFPKVASAVLLTFKKKIVHIFIRFKNRWNWPWPVFKSSRAAPNNLLTIRSEGFELVGVEKLLEDFGINGLELVRNVLIQYKIKGTVEKIMSR
jgi:hypothetical protein